jgi:hypothetical protein
MYSVIVTTTTTTAAAAALHNCRQLSMAAAHRLADPEKELLSKTDVFIFDCDGVIWKGDSVIPGIPAVLDKVCNYSCRITVTIITVCEHLIRDIPTVHDRVCSICRVIVIIMILMSVIAVLD